MTKYATLLCMFLAGAVLAQSPADRDTTISNFLSGRITASIGTNETRNVTLGATTTCYQVRLSSSAWDDMLGIALTATRSGTDDIDLDNTLGGQSFKTSSTTNLADDHVIFIYQQPHACATNTDMIPHVHFYQTALDQTNMWWITYAVISIGATKPSADTLLGPATNEVAWTTNTLHQLAKFPAIKSGGISSVIRVRLYRNGSFGTGAVTASDFDIHYRKDGFGSDAESSKSY